MLEASEPPLGVSRAREFRTTQWSVVLAAREGSPTQAAAALEQLCRSYWYPLYAYLRRDGKNPHDAQDLTQGFLASVIEKRDLDAATPEGGRFRSFLLGTLKHYLADERRKANAQKRGGGRPVLSIDAEEAESRYRIEPVDEETPETHFERQWARLVLERVMDRLRKRHAERGRAELFTALQPCLGGVGCAVPYSEVGARLGLSEGAVKVAVRRLRQEFGHLLRHEIAQTVADESEIDEEIRRLIRVTSP